MIIKMDSLFSNISVCGSVEVLVLDNAFLVDTLPERVHLGIGAYRTDDIKPWILPVVKKVKEQIIQDRNINHEYLPILGIQSFITASTELLLGKDCPAIQENRVFGVQALSGTGALVLGAKLLARALGHRTVYFSDPTWENHSKVFTGAGFTNFHIYRYYDNKARGLNFDGLIEDLSAAIEGSIVVLQSCAHNPTGCDPSKDQWKQIADVCEARKLFPFFDSAYQGFASGDPIDDAFSVRYFVSRGFELFCAQSYSKNFLLYSERIGNLVVVQNDARTTEALKSQFTLFIRQSYLTPPAFGGHIVRTVLNNPEMRSEWMDCINIMCKRILKMRHALFDELIKLNTPGTWNHIVDQIGMYTYIGLNEEQVKFLISKYHIYLLASGRINLCGLNDKNVEYVAKAIHQAVTTIPA